MIIKLKTATDFTHAVTYLQNQNYKFDRYDTQLMIRFAQEGRAKSALEELNETQNIFEESTAFDLLEALAV